MYTIILKHVLQQSDYIYHFNRLNHNVLISTFVWMDRELDSWPEDRGFDSRPGLIVGVEQTYL